jgi:hypothetical protein
MAFQFQRYLRTPHSEIYGVFSTEGEEDSPIGRIDIHYSPVGLVNGMVVLEKEISEEDTAELLAKIDQELVEVAELADDVFEITVAIASKIETYGKDEDDEDE